MRRIFLSLIAVAAFSPSRDASSASVTVGPTDYSVTTYNPGDSETLDIARFDPSLGTLTGVSFSVTYTTSGVSMTFENLQNQSASFGIGLKQNFLFNAPGVSSQTGYQVLFPFQNVAIGASDGSADFSGSDSVVVSQTNAMSGTLIGSAVFGLSSYIGPGTFATQIFSGDLIDVNGLGTLPSRQDNHTGTTTGTVTVTYTYTPAVAVPEPGSLALSGTAALIGLGLGLRRRLSGRRSAGE